MGILKGIIDRFRAMGKTENEILSIVEAAADKATVNPDVQRMKIHKNRKSRLKQQQRRSLRQFCKWERLCNRQKRQF